MKTALLNAASTLLLLFAFSGVKAQPDVYASYVRDSSADFRGAYKTANSSQTDYAYVSDLLTLLSTSYLRVGFPVSGSAGDVIDIVVQGSGTVLNTSLLNNVTVRLYDSSGANVANGSGSSLLQLYLLSPATHLYAIRFVSNPTDTYRFKEARIEFNNLLSVSLVSEFRVYGIYYQTHCAATTADAVYDYGSTSLLFGHVDNPNNAVDASASNYATMSVPLDLLTLLPPAYLDLSFTAPGRAGDYVGFTVSQASSVLSAALLANIDIDVYNTAGTVVSYRHGLSLLDLKLLAGSGGEYMLGYVTPTGSYNIGRVRMTLHSVLSLLEDIRVHNAFHYDMLRRPVVVSASGPLDICAGGNVTLTAVDSSGGTSYLWNTGATTASITVSVAGDYSVQVTDNVACTRYSSVVHVSVGSSLAPVITGDTVVCPGIAGQLHTSVSYTSYSWSTGSTAASIAATAGVTYTVTVTDASGCTGTDVVTVGSGPASVSVTGAVHNSGCSNSADGSITLSGSGGYSYLWSNGTLGNTISALQPGLYTATVIDNASHCRYQRSFTVGADADLSVKTTIVNTSDKGANDGSVAITPVGGSGSYTYLWSNGATTASINGLAAGVYIVQVTDVVHGCHIGDTVVVSDGNNPLTVTTGTGANTGCSTYNGTASASVSGGSGSYTYHWSTGASTPSIAGLAPGTYVVYVQDNVSGYTKGATIVVADNSGFVVNAAVTPASCTTYTGALNTTITGGSGSYTYSWNTGSASPSLTDLQQGIYIVTVTDNVTGCEEQHTFTVNQAGAPTATIATTQPSCTNNSNGSIAVTATGTHNKYLWSNGNTTASLTGLIAGDYALTITDTSTGCSSNYNVNLTARDQMRVTADKAANTSCSGAPTGSASVTVTGGVVPYTYAWSTGAATPSVSGLSAGAYTVTVSDNNACASTLVLTIPDGSALAPMLAGDTSLCPGISGSLHTVATYPHYLWSTGATTSSIAVVAGVTYWVQVTDAGGCTGADTLTIAGGSIFTSQPGAVAIHNASCSNSADGSITLTPGSGSYTYLWSNGGTGQSVSSLLPGLYTLIITDNANGCQFMNSFTISAGTDLAVKTAVVNTSNAGMHDGQAQVTPVGGSGNYTYTWSNGAATAGIGGLQAGIYTVQITDVASGCHIGDTMLVSDGGNPLVVTVATTANTGCSAHNGAAVASVSGGSGNYTYVWSNGNATASVAGLAPGMYVVAVRDNANGYTGGATASVADSSGIHVNIVATPTSCAAHTGVLTASVSGGSGSYNYHWSNGSSAATISSLQQGVYILAVNDNTTGCSNAGAFVINQASAPLATLSITPPLCANNADGSILVNTTGITYLYTWSNGLSTKNITGLKQGDYALTITDTVTYCSASYIASLTARDQLSISANKTANSACPSLPNGGAVVSITGGTLPYTYMWSNGAATQSLSAVAAGVYTLTVTDNNGCTAGVDITIANDSDKVLHITFSNIVHPSTLTAPSGGADAQVSGGTPPYAYSWSNGASSMELANVVAGTYTLTVTDASGCSVTSSLLIDTLGGGNGGGNNGDTTLIIHNVITPNGDNINDYWFIEGIAKYPDISIQILDKWGDVVYTQQRYRNDWKGTDKNGKTLASGTYFYVLKLNTPNPPGGKGDYAGYLMVQQ